MSTLLISHNALRRRLLARAVDPCLRMKLGVSERSHRKRSFTRG